MSIKHQKNNDNDNYKTCNNDNENDDDDDNDNDNDNDDKNNNIHLMSDPEGNSQFCFPESPDVSQEEVKGNIKT